MSIDLPLYRIRDWDHYFENSRSRQVERLSYVCVPNKLDGDGYTELVSHPDGPAYYGVWVVLLAIASKCEPRGTLIRDSLTPHTPETIGRMARFPASLVGSALDCLSAPGVGWIEKISLSASHVYADVAKNAQTSDAVVTSESQSSDVQLSLSSIRSDSDSDSDGALTIFRKVSAGKLKDTGVLLDWIRHAVDSDPVLFAGLQDRETVVVALAERALAKGENPAALFAMMVGGRKWSQATSKFRTLAKVRLHKFVEESNGK